MRTTTRGRHCVLVVEDYRDARELYAEYLEYQGFRVAVAENGYEALSIAAKLHPDIILMDLSMPGLDGWEATRRLKMSPATRDIPIVAVTGHAMVGQHEAARQAGCDAYVTKPCLPEDLVAHIRRVLGIARPPRVVRRAGGRPAGTVRRRARA